MEWHTMETLPEIGRKVVIAYNDGCSSTLALMTEIGPLEGETGWALDHADLAGGLWAYLPDNFPLRFMEVTSDDWR